MRADGPAAAGRDGRRASLATRTLLVTTTVAALAVLLAGAVSLGLVRGAAEQQARETLRRQADLLASTVDRGGARPARLAALLRAQSIRVVLLAPGAAGTGRVALGDLAELRAGKSVSRVEQRPIGRVFVEARPTDAGGAVVLTQPATVVGPNLADARRRILLALLVGLAGAGLAGALLSRWLTRPLRLAAQAAHRLSTGARDVRLTPVGPAEVAELAEALNRLGAALATSEGRQREFLLSVSHELRTPLTAVRGYAEALADGVLPPEEVSRTGATMLAEAQRLERLVSDLLDLARLGAEEFRIDRAPVDLCDLVRRAAEVWRDRCAREGVILRAEVPDQPLTVHTDATRVRQILDGLAENALRVTPAGQPIVLAAAACPPDVVVEVRDGGPGLRPEDLEVAFERSALYDRYRGVRRVGTGVGLALVAGLASRLGGSAAAGAAAEGGARFVVRLPAGG